MFVLQSLLAASALFLAGESEAEKQPIEAAKLIGKWHSTKLEGKDIGNFIVSIDAEFTEDGKVTMTASLKEGGDVKPMTIEGTYKVTPDALEVTFNKETQRNKAWFEDGRLVLQDQKLDSRAHFERVEAKK